MSEQASNDVLMSLPERNEGETFRAWYARLNEAQQDEYDTRPDSLTLAAAVQGEREARHELNDCAQCGATLHPPTDPPHCEDCIVDEEHREAWEDKRDRPAPCVACDGNGRVPEPWSDDNSVVPCPHCCGNGLRASRTAPAVDVMAVVREFLDAENEIDTAARRDVVMSGARYDTARVALRSLVSGEAKAKTDTRDTSAFTQEYNGSFVPHSKGEEKEKP